MTRGLLRRDQDTDMTEEQPREAKVRPRGNTNPENRTPVPQAPVTQHCGKIGVCCYSQFVFLLWRPQQTNV